MSSNGFFEQRIELAKHMKTILANGNSDNGNGNENGKICELSGSIKKIQRIGTKSVYGQVFLVSEKYHPHHMAAAKIMYNTPENRHEIKWYKIFEKFVSEGKCLHFPLVYFDRLCSTCAFDNGDDKPQNKTKNQKCILAVSELAAGDFKHFISSSHKKTLEDYISFVAQTMIAVFALTTQNVSHNDLHWGNVLYLPSPDLKGKWMSYTIGNFQIDIKNTGYFWILWDFGKMKKNVATTNAEVFNKDLYRILHFARWAKNEKMKKVPDNISQLCDVAIECIQHANSWPNFIELFLKTIPPKLMSLVTSVCRVKPNEAAVAKLATEVSKMSRRVTMMGPYIAK